MANYILTYDLFGRVPSHGEVQDHIGKAGFQEYAKILDDGWYIGTPHPLTEVHEYIMQIFSDNDRIALIEVKAAKLENLEEPVSEILEAFERHK